LKLIALQLALAAALSSAARDRKTAKYFSREAGARRGWALVSATLRPLYAVWFVTKILNDG
jgi:hypothetical protein